MVDKVPFTSIIAGDNSVTYPANFVVLSGASGSMVVNSNLFVDSSGRIGIGTSVPAGRVDIRGELGVTAASNFGGAVTVASLVSNGAVSGTTGTFSGDVSVADKIVHTGDTNTAIRFPATDSIAMETDGVERLRIILDGRVGLGTSTPTFNLQLALPGTVDSRQIGITETVYTSGFRATYLDHYGTIAPGTSYGISNANLGSLKFQNTSAGLIGTNGSAPLVFATLSLERMRITSDGSVGIGTATPATTLHVQGDVTFTGAIDERVFTLSGTTSVSLDPSNGTVQLHTLTANTSYADSLIDGESLTLMIDDGTAFTVTWPTITWVNNGRNAPTLATTGFTVISIWKAGATLYGALVGNGT
jgi:hypothetical protein